MFNSVLVPLDGTPSMERSLPVAAALARETGATLRLLRPAFAHTGPGPDAADAHLAAVVEAKHYLAGQAGHLEPAGVAVETVVAHGEPSEAVIDELRLGRTDLVVLALPSHADRSRWVALAEQVLAHTSVPTLLVPAWDVVFPTPPLEDGARLLVPLDGSALDEAVLPLAAALAADMGGEIVLVRAVPPAETTILPGGDPGSRWDAELAIAVQAAEVGVRRAGERLRSWGIYCEVDVRVGWPADAIAAAGRERGAAIAVAAAIWGTRAWRLRCGDVRRGLLCEAGLPLLLVPAGAVPATAPRVRPPVRARRAPTPTFTGIPGGPRSLLTLDAAERKIIGEALRGFAGTAPGGLDRTPERVARLLDRLGAGPPPGRVAGETASLEARHDPSDGRDDLPGGRLATVERRDAPVIFKELRRTVAGASPARRIVEPGRRERHNVPPRLPKVPAGGTT